MTLAVAWRNLEYGWQEPLAATYSDSRDFAAHNYVLPIVGRSGRGKSTLLYVLSGMLQPLAGEVEWTWPAEPRAKGLQVWLRSDRSRPVATWDRGRRFKAAQAARARRFGFLTQDSVLLPTFTVAENCRHMLRIRGVPEHGLDQSGARYNRIERAVKRFLIDGEALGTARARRPLLQKNVPMLAKFPAELSGGQRQRMALALAIAHDPTVLFADEPTASLDNTTTSEILGRVRQWLDLAPGKRAFVLVTHREEVFDNLRAPRAIRLGEKGPEDVVRSTVIPGAIS
jgi:ABC-type lipoprotein export system ATPase subunit